MGEELVSVIITTYGNRQDYLAEAIESVLNQTYNNIEIIVIDDNGKNTPFQLNNELYFKEFNNIQYYPLNNNSGAQIARNTGIIFSKGKYIAFLDDDDIWDKEKISKQVKYLEEQNLDLVFCNGYRFFNDDTNDKVLYQKNFIDNNKISFDNELQGDMIGSTSHPLMRKICFAKTGLFDINFQARQDYDMWIRFCKYFAVAGINEPLFYYRYHAGDRITKSLNKKLDSYLKLFVKYKTDYNDNSKAKASILFSICSTYLKNRNIVKFLYYFAYALYTNPLYIVKSIYSYFIKGYRF